MSLCSYFCEHGLTVCFLSDLVKETPVIIIPKKIIGTPKTMSVVNRLPPDASDKVEGNPDV